MTGYTLVILLRDANGDGIADRQFVFLSGLNSPFGITLVDSTLIVANTDALVKFPYSLGDTIIASPGTTLTALPAGTINHHWTKSVIASPDGSKLYVGVGSKGNVAENGIAAEGPTTVHCGFLSTSAMSLAAILSLTT